MTDRLDDIDRQIVASLQRDARLSVAALAEAVGLTPTPLRTRLERLEAAGVIRGYHADVDPAKVGRPVTAFVHVTLKDHALENHRRFVKAIRAMPEVLEAHHLAGEEDFLLKVAVESVGAFEVFLLERLTTISCIGRVKTTFALSSSKHRAPVPTSADLGHGARDSGRDAPASTAAREVASAPRAPKKGRSR